MSYCVVHMQKMKMSALGGIQSHNQREHPSKKNHDIDYTKSRHNIDLVNYDQINYQRAVKERIEELKLGKAVRKDAVVYSSFIVSSDRLFFDILAIKEHERREGQERESVYWGVEPPTPLEYLDKNYREDCVREGARKFFEKALYFFADRYGYENIINATIHFDEATPHMHIGIVPVTSDGRLSAKELFTPLQLKQLQTDFAKNVGAMYGLERGTEGSKAKHLDELSFKLQKQQERQEEVYEEVRHLEVRKMNLTHECRECSQELEKRSQELREVEGRVTTLQEQKNVLERKLDALTDEVTIAKRALSSIHQQAGGVLSQREWEAEIERKREEQKKETRLSLLERFVRLPVIKPLWEKFMEQQHSRQDERAER